MSVIWHDLECGAYAEDLSLWLELAGRYPGQVLDVGAGTGRVALELARAGHPVTALDCDAELLAELDRRAAGVGVGVRTVVGDARDFDLPGERFSLCVVPMQTIQLLGGGQGRRAFLRCTLRHLEGDGAVAIALAEELDEFELEDGVPSVLPDICELDGVVYSSQPTAVRVDGDGFVLERRRETVAAGGARSVSEDVIHLDRVSADQLEREAAQAGLRTRGRATVAATHDYVGSSVVILGVGDG